MANKVLCVRQAMVESSKVGAEGPRQARQERQHTPSQPQAVSSNLNQAMEVNEEEGQKEALRAELLALDKTIAKLQDQDDEEVLELLAKKKARREELWATLSSLKPLHTQLKVATERRDKAQKKLKNVDDEVNNLERLLRAKKEEQAQAKEVAERAQTEVEALQRRQTEEAAKASPFVHAASSSPFSSGQAMTAQQWSRGF